MNSLTQLVKAQLITYTSPKMPELSSFQFSLLVLNLFHLTKYTQRKVSRGRAVVKLYFTAKMIFFF